MKNRPTNIRGLILDVILVLIPVALYAAIVLYGINISAPRADIGTILSGIYLQYLGVLFLLSYYFPHKTYILRGLDLFCEFTSLDPGRWKAIFLFFMGMFLGTFLIAHGFGLIFT